MADDEWAMMVDVDTLHHIPQKKQLKINFDSRSFLWAPTSTDDDEWDNNYDDLVAKIEENFGIKKDDIEVIEDAEECEVTDGDELKNNWSELEEGDGNVLDFTVISDAKPTLQKTAKVQI